MTGAEYLIRTLIDNGISDMFGIPGGVLLELIYSADKFKKNIKTHLMNHEQDAGYAALGYAQASGKVAVAYATRGPGFTNLITPLTDSYFDSIPVIFITAHSKPFVETEKRFVEEQEFDTVHMVAKVTKKAVRIETGDELVKELDVLIKECKYNRPGPVLIDVKESVFYENINSILRYRHKCQNKNKLSVKDLQELKKAIDKSQRPVVLIGNGIYQSDSKNELIKFIRNNNFPVVSSSISVDLLSGSKKYFGNIGSHGQRSANYILYKSDLIISLGNRLAFPKNSKTFGDFCQKKIIRIEVDKQEIQSQLMNEYVCYANVKDVLIQLQSISYNSNISWLSFCVNAGKVFKKYEAIDGLDELESVLRKIPSKSIIVSDVGNNEFYLLNTYRKVMCRNRLLYSKSFSSLGNSLPKAIGAYFATKKNIVAFMGDQGALFNIQALEFINKNKLPVIICVINNFSSGMIKDREISQKRKKLIHTTLESGYTVPDFKNIAYGFGIPYCRAADFDCSVKQTPVLVECKVNENLSIPFLPKGAKPYEFIPEMEKQDIIKLTALESKYKCQ